MSTVSRTDARQEILDLLESLRHGFLGGSLKLWKEHLAEDVVLLGVGDPRVLKGKESYLDYLRTSSKKGWLRKVRTRVEDVKFSGDLAIVVESYTIQHEIKGRAYQDAGRATEVLVIRGGRWYLTHMHMETLSRNRIIG